MESTMTGPEIQAERERRGMTQQEAADALGVSLRTYCRWEHGESRPMGLYRVTLRAWVRGGEGDDHAP